MIYNRDEAEKEFIECSEVAKSEIKAFHTRRLAEFRQAMMVYVEVGPIRLDVISIKYQILLSIY